MKVLDCSEISLSVPAKDSMSKELSARNHADTMDSLTYYQRGEDSAWYSTIKAKSCPMDVFHIVGITTYKNLRLKCSRYFYLDSWKELLELNRTFKDCDLWYYKKEFLYCAKRILEDLAYSFDWSGLSIYYPKTLQPLIISPETIFDGEKRTTPVILIAPRLQGLDRNTRKMLEGTG